MRHSKQELLPRQVDFLREQFLQKGRLPFTDIPSSESISEAMEQIKVPWRNRIFTPSVTLWGLPRSSAHATFCSIMRFRT